MIGLLQNPVEKFYEEHMNWIHMLISWTGLLRIQDTTNAGGMLGLACVYIYQYPLYIGKNTSKQFNPWAFWSKKTWQRPRLFDFFGWGSVQGFESFGTFTVTLLLHKPWTDTQEPAGLGEPVPSTRTAAPKSQLAYRSGFLSMSLAPQLYYIGCIVKEASEQRLDRSRRPQAGRA